MGNIVHQHTHSPEDQEQRKKEIPEGNIKIEHVAKQKKCADDYKKNPEE